MDQRDENKNPSSESVESPRPAHGRFLSNTHDPNDTFARHYHVFSHNATLGGGLAMEEEWRQHLQWIAQNVIGRPQATDTYTVEELEAMGMVGLYAPASSGTTTTR